MTDKERAYRLVRTAIERGVLVRPDQCARCEGKPGLGTDGRSLIQAHHHDYSKPLDVEWICAKCHRCETPLPSKPGGVSIGSRNGQARLTEDIVRQIKKLRVDGASFHGLARQFGVDRATIKRCCKGRTWAHV